MCAGHILEYLVHSAHKGLQIKFHNEFNSDSPKFWPAAAMNELNMPKLECRFSATAVQSMICFLELNALLL